MKALSCSQKKALVNIFKLKGWGLKYDVDNYNIILSIKIYQNRYIFSH